MINLQNNNLFLGSSNNKERAIIIASSNTAESDTPFSNYIGAGNYNRITNIEGKIVKQGDIFSMTMSWEFTTTKATYDANSEWFNFFRATKNSENEFPFDKICKDGFTAIFYDVESGGLYSGLVSKRFEQSGRIWTNVEITTANLIGKKFFFSATWVNA